MLQNLSPGLKRKTLPSKGRNLVGPESFYFGIVLDNLFNTSKKCHHTLKAEEEKNKEEEENLFFLDMLSMAVLLVTVSDQNRLTRIGKKMSLKTKLPYSLR